MSEITAKVAAVVSDSLLAINAGSAQGVEPNDIVTLYSTFEIKDPDTQVTLGKVRVPKLRLRVNHVQEKLCTAAITSIQDREINLVIDVTRVRRLKRIVQNAFDEEPGISVAVDVGEPVVIHRPDNTGTNKN